MRAIAFRLYKSLTYHQFNFITELRSIHFIGRLVGRSCGGARERVTYLLYSSILYSSLLFSILLFSIGVTFGVTQRYSFRYSCVTVSVTIIFSRSSTKKINNIRKIFFLSSTHAHFYFLSFTINTFIRSPPLQPVLMQKTFFGQR